MTRPSVLFVCVHNAGRSQMGAAYTHHLSGGAVEVRSAGSAPADSINPAVRDALLEEGIDISAETPKILTDEAVVASDVVITMGCGDTCPYYPGKRYLDWTLEDPAGQGVAAVRPIRDEIKRRVLTLLGELGIEPVELPTPKPTLLFVCVKNGGKSQMAAALARRFGGDAVEVHSAGTHPGSKLNEESARSVEELGATFGGESPKPIDPDVLRRADRVIVIGTEADVRPVEGMRGTIEVWDTVEPSKDGIEGEERMRLVRDDIAARVKTLLDDLTPNSVR